MDGATQVGIDQMEDHDEARILPFSSTIVGPAKDSLSDSFTATVDLSDGLSLITIITASTSSLRTYSTTSTTPLLPIIPMPRTTISGPPSLEKGKMDLRYR